MVEAFPGLLPPQTHTLPIQDRIERGRALRERAARRHHGVWKPPADRRDPVEILIEQGESRLPNLLPIRYARMKPTPFTFLTRLTTSSGSSTSPIRTISPYCADTLTLPS